MIKDHLGNVRMVLTEEQKIDKYPVASPEDTKIATEKQYYDIKDAYVRPKSEATGITAYVNDNGIGNNPADPTFEATNSDKVYRLNSNANKTGLGITLKVMAGDKIDVFGKSYYFQNNPGSGYNNYLGLIDVLNGFLGTPLAAGATGVHGAVTGTDINTTPGTAVISTLFGNQTTQNSGAPLKPRAFINVIFFDEQFKARDYKASIVGDNSTVKDHYTDLQNLTAPKSGYVYIYCSNETPVNVFFDNLQVVHKRSAMLEETHYYPFGLVMTSISSKSFNTQNKFYYNGNESQEKEFHDGSGLELYDFNARNFNSQIGRFSQIDPLSEEFEDMSPYSFGFNNPILFSDPTGMAPQGDTIAITKESYLNTIVINSYIPKQLDSENGQVMEPITPWETFWNGNSRRWNGYVVQTDGYLYLKDGAPVKMPQIVQLGVPDVGKKAAAKTAGKAASKWLIYRGTKKINGRLRLYIGKAKNALNKRYSKKEIDDLAAEVIEKLDNLPDNATALGVEQAILQLNGGKGVTANIRNATIKQTYVEAGLKWLESNIPDWRTVFQFQ